MSANPELNNTLVEGFDLEFSHHIGNRRYEISTPYHGGQCAGDVYSIIFGHEITDDDSNEDYIDEIRNAKEEDYKEEYLVFLEVLKKQLTADMGKEDDYDKFVNDLIEFLDNNKPGFYTVEASS
jgi:DNA-binding Lrp family transcriptional regulator